MAKSSMSIGHGSPEHNDRSIDIDYLLPTFLRKANYVDFSAKDAKAKLTYLYNEAKINYTKYFSQNIQASSYTFEAIINLNAHHNISHLNSLLEILEEDTGFTHYQKSIHKDEGVLVEYIGKSSDEWNIEDYEYDSEDKKWFDKSGEEVFHFKTYRMGSNIFEKDQVVYTDKKCTKPLDMSKIHVKYNYHAHVNFFTLDKITGKQLYRKDISRSDRKKVEQEVLEENPHLQKGEPKSKERKLFNKVVREKMFGEKGFVVYNKLKLSQLQTLVAEALDMERGRVSVQEEADRLGVEVSQPRQRLTHKQFKKANESAEKVRLETLAKLKDVNAINKKLRAELQAKSFDTPEEKRKEFAVLESEIRTLREQVRAKTLTITELEERIASLTGDVKERDEYIEVLESGYSEIETTLFGEDQERSVNVIVEEVLQAKSKAERLEEVIKLFTQQIINKGKSLFLNAFKYFYRTNEIDIGQLRTKKNNLIDQAQLELDKIDLVLSVYSSIGKVTKNDDEKYILENDEQKTFIQNEINTIELSKIAQNNLLEENKGQSSPNTEKDSTIDSQRSNKSKKNRSKR